MNRFTSKLCGERGIALIKRFHAMGLRLKLALLIFISAIAGIALFIFLWLHIIGAWNITAKLTPDIFPFSWDENAFVAELKAAAPDYTVPAYDDGKNQWEKMKGFFALGDFDTRVSIYGDADGLYRASSFHTAVDTSNNTPLLQSIYMLSLYSPAFNFVYGDFYPMEFQNGTFNVYIESARKHKFLYFYFLLILFLSVFLFLAPPLLFMNRSIKQILHLKQEVFLISQGDLSHTIDIRSRDEIGTLSRELDHMRLALASLIEKESESRRANQDLITAMSHDLRTPLTILKGYLEIMKLGRIDAAKTADYLNRCLQKTGDIQEMTDRMFEYALVYEDHEAIDEKSVPVEFLVQCLKENMDFLALSGFTPQTVCDFSEEAAENTYLSGDCALLKRIAANLFSNILKYGSKKEPVELTLALSDTDGLLITLKNHIRADTTGISSNRIGLRSAEKMMQLHHGSLRFYEESDCFQVFLTFPVET